MAESEHVNQDRRELLMKSLLGGLLAMSVAGRRATAGSHLRVKKVL